MRHKIRNRPILEKKHLIIRIIKKAILHLVHCQRRHVEFAFHHQGEMLTVCPESDRQFCVELHPLEVFLKEYFYLLVLAVFCFNSSKNVDYMSVM